MNGEMCLGCEYIILEGCWIGISFRHCQHPKLKDGNNYIWFMYEEDCPKKQGGKP